MSDPTFCVAVQTNPTKSYALSYSNSGVHTKILPVANSEGHVINFVNMWENTLCLANVSPDGSIAWHKEIPWASAGYPPLSITDSGDGHVVAATQYNPASSNNKISVFKIDAETGTVAASKSFGSNTFRLPPAVAKTGNGYAIASEVHRLDTTGTSSSIGVLHTDSDLALVEEKADCWYSTVSGTDADFYSSQTAGVIIAEDTADGLLVADRAKPIHVINPASNGALVGQHNRKIVFVNNGTDNYQWSIWDVDLGPDGSVAAVGGATILGDWRSILMRMNKEGVVKGIYFAPDHPEITGCKISASGSVWVSGFTDTGGGAAQLWAAEFSSDLSGPIASKATPAVAPYTPPNAHTTGVFASGGTPNVCMAGIDPATGLQSIIFSSLSDEIEIKNATCNPFTVETLSPTVMSGSTTFYTAPLDIYAYGID